MPAGASGQAATGILQIRDDGRYVLRFERHIGHPPERVWRALTEPGQLRQWFPTDIEGERKPGAKIRFVFRAGAPRAEDMPGLLEHDPEDLDGEFTEFDPPRLLAYTWGEEDLRWELEPAVDGCRLIFTHTFTERSGIPHPALPGKEGRQDRRRLGRLPRLARRAPRRRRCSASGSVADALQPLYREVRLGGYGAPAWVRQRR